jgi:phosphoserine phosphatase RsbU/P
MSGCEQGCSANAGIDRPGGGGDTRFCGPRGPDGSGLATSTLQLESVALTRILDVARMLGRPIELDAMLTLVIDAAREVLGAERGTVFLYDAAADELVVRVATGLEHVRLGARAGIAGRCAQSRCLVNVPECYAHPQFNPQVDQQTGYRTRCLLAVPLIGLDDELVGVMQVLNKLEGAFDDQDERIATALAAQCAVALQRSRLIEDRLHRQKLEHDLQTAREIQRRVLPAAMPAPAGYELAGWARPAEQTGGDIYDAVPLHDGRILLLLADATGHGVGPALSITQVRAMVRMAARLRCSLDEAFSHLNDQLAEDLAEDRFVTAFLGVLDPARHVIEYHSAGQGPLFVPMGIAPGIAAGERPRTVPLGPGEMLAVISDGVFEARNGDRKAFGAQRVREVLIAHRHLPVADLARQLVAAVDAHIGHQTQADDMTLVLVKRRAAESG